MLTETEDRRVWRTTLTLDWRLAEKLMALAEENGLRPNAMIAQLIARAPSPQTPRREDKGQAAG